MADYPSLPLWTDAYLADTMHLSCTESGAYLHLLIAAWRSPACALPDDDKKLCRMARATPREWSKCRDVVLAFWDRDEKTGMWTQKRLLAERDYVTANSSRMKRAADARWLKEKETDNANASSVHMQNGMQETMQNTCISDAPIPIPIKEAAVVTRDHRVDVIAAFDRALMAAFGKSQERPWPHPKDIVFAGRWLEAGATLETLESVFSARMGQMAAKGQRPPASLNYFDQMIADAIATAKAPMPKGTANAKPNRATPADAERDRRSAIMDALGPDLAREMGTDDSDLGGRQADGGGAGDDCDLDSETGSEPDAGHPGLCGGDGPANSICADVRPAGGGPEIVGGVLQSGSVGPSTGPADGSDRTDDQDPQIPRPAEASRDQEARRGQADAPAPAAAPGAARSDEDVKNELLEIPPQFRRTA